MTPGSRTVWTVLGAVSILVGYRAVTDGYDPIPQLAGIGASGIVLLFLADPFPKFAGSLAMLLAVSLALNWDNIPRLQAVTTTPQERRIR